MDKVDNIEFTTTIVDDYLSLPRLDRLAVYRTLSISDRMRLDRKVRDRKTAGKNKSSVKKNTIGKPSLSPFLLAHLRHVLEDDASTIGVKTQDYIRSQLAGGELLDV